MTLEEGCELGDITEIKMLSTEVAAVAPWARGSILAAARLAEHLLAQRDEARRARNRYLRALNVMMTSFGCDHNLGGAYPDCPRCMAREIVWANEDGGSGS